MIGENPGCYDQDTFGGTGQGDFKLESYAKGCNSPCCVASWIIVVFHDKDTPLVLYNDQLETEALRLLGAETEEERAIILHLFDKAEYWPLEFTNPYDEVTPECLRRRIEHYIETGSMWVAE